MDQQLMKNEELIQRTKACFTARFGLNPAFTVHAPGRINIIGEHVDYNDGFVLPAAIDMIICFAFHPNDTGICRIVAMDLEEEFLIDPSAEISQDEMAWTNYLRGVLVLLQQKNMDIRGFDCVFGSNIPVGAGLSSSAALECGFLAGIDALFQLHLPPVEIALMGQQAEHWTGVNCGIMDQFASVLGKEDQVVKIDCRSLEYAYHVADLQDCSLVLFDSAVKHSLASTAYNQRRTECEEGLKMIRKHYPDITSFRDCNPHHIEALKHVLSPTVYKRCSFVVNEIARVEKACDALETGNMVLLGRLMHETHIGLSKEYEVSCPEIDFLVDLAMEEAFVLGARMMGGGFGGCTINLVRNGFQDILEQKLTTAYRKKFGLELKSYAVRISDGVRVVS
jgi:galactokinase